MEQEDGTKPVIRKLSMLQVFRIMFVESKALRIFVTNFLMAYNIRAGISVLLRAITMAAKRPKDLLSLDKILGESGLSFRVEAVRIGFFVGGFSGIYAAVTHSLTHLVSGGKRLGWHSVAGGYLAGLSLAFMNPNWHRTLALYMSTRMAQCMYNYAKTNGYWHFWGSSWSHGDSLLFIASTAQVMYAYVMRPETLPPSYYKFIVRQGPIDEVMLQAVRDNNRGRPINLSAVNTYIEKSGGKEALEACKSYLSSNTPRIIPSRALHPYTAKAWISAWGAFTGTVKQIFPVYLSLALVPAVVLRFRHFAQAPVSIFAKAIAGAFQSTLFLGTFCGGYQLFIVIQRMFLERFKLTDHKLWYYVAALFSGFAILLERKSRRSELALYVFPRALDSLYMILYDHKMAFRLPHGEILMFSAAMSVLMYFYENDINNLSPLIAKLLQRFMPLKTLMNTQTAEEVVSEKSPLRHSVSVISLSGN